MKRLILIALTGVLCAAASTVARAQEINPKLKTPKKVLVLLPDLVVSGLSIAKGGVGEQSVLAITVKNTCGAPAAQYVVKIEYKYGQGKKFETVTWKWKALKGGESEMQKYALLYEPSQLVVTADYGNKVKEDVEGNNWSKLNPNSSPFPDGPNHCKPKN